MAASHGTSLLKSELAFNRIIEEVAHCALELANIQPLAQNYRTNLEAGHADLDTEATGMQSSHPQGGSKHCLSTREIQGHVVEPESPELGEISGLVGKSAGYEFQVEAAVRSLCEKLGELVDEVLGSRDYGRPEPAPESCRQDGPDEPDQTKQPRVENSD